MTGDFDFQPQEQEPDDLPQPDEQEDETPQPEPPPAPIVTFDQQPLAPTVRWVWMGGYLLTIAVLSVGVLQLDLFLLPTPTGLVPAGTGLILLGLAIWRLNTRYRNWSWQLTEQELIIDHGVVFKLTRVIPRIRVQHVDLTSGPLDRFFGLRSLAIYTAGTREADARIPGLSADRAEELRHALVGK